MFSITNLKAESWMAVLNIAEEIKNNGFAVQSPEFPMYHKFHVNYKKQIDI